MEFRYCTREYFCLEPSRNLHALLLSLKNFCLTSCIKFNLEEFQYHFLRVKLEMKKMENMKGCLLNIQPHLFYSLYVRQHQHWRWQKKRGEKKIDKVQISFQFGWCDVNVICDGNKGSIKHRTERERKREKCYAATYIYSYLQYHTHMMLLYTKRSASHRSCAVHVTWKNIL